MLNTEFHNKLGYKNIFGFYKPKAMNEIINLISTQFKGIFRYFTEIN